MRTAFFINQIIKCLFSILILVFSIGLYGKAQPVRFSQAMLQFNLQPGAKWKLVDSLFDDQIKANIYYYERLEEAENKAAHPVSLTVYFINNPDPTAADEFNSSLDILAAQLTGEKLQDKFAMIQEYLIASSGARVIEKFTTSDPKGRLTFNNAVGYKVNYDQSEQGYQVFLMSNKIMVQFSFKCPIQKFPAYDAELLGIIKSIRSTEAVAMAAPIAGNKKQPAGKTAARPMQSKAYLSDYFPVCNGYTYTYTESNAQLGPVKHTVVYEYANSKKIGSRIFKGYRISSSNSYNSDHLIYYNCENGEIITHFETEEWNTEQTGEEELFDINDPLNLKPDYQKTKIPVYRTTLDKTGEFTTIIELKANAPKGTSWITKGKSGETERTITSTIAEKGISLTVQNKIYKDVIKVHREIKAIIMEEEQTILTQDVYYARGIGKIKTVNTSKMEFVGELMSNVQEMVSCSVPQ